MLQDEVIERKDVCIPSNCSTIREARGDIRGPRNSLGISATFITKPSFHSSLKLFLSAIFCKIPSNVLPGIQH